MKNNKLNILVAEPDSLSAETMAELIINEGHTYTHVQSSEDDYIPLNKHLDILFYIAG